MEAPDADSGLIASEIVMSNANVDGCVLPRMSRWPCLAAVLMIAMAACSTPTSQSEVDSRAAWGVKPGAGSTSLRRLDLKTGVVSTYLTVPYHQAYKPGDLSLDLVSLNADGTPLVLERDWQHPYPWHLALVAAPDNPVAIQIPDDWAAGWPIWDNGDPYQQGRELRGTVLSQGIWMFGRNAFSGLALLGADGAVKQLTSGPDIFAIAGGCH